MELKNVMCLIREFFLFFIIVLDKNYFLLLRISWCDEEFKVP